MQWRCYNSYPSAVPTEEKQDGAGIVSGLPTIRSSIFASFRSGHRITVDMDRVVHQRAEVSPRAGRLPIATPPAAEIHSPC